MGKVFNGNIGRITALDPALPLFSEQDFDILSKSNAKFVDVIHTCSNILGTITPLGTVDFYPNFGTAPQPGCEVLDIFTACILYVLIHCVY